MFQSIFHSFKKQKSHRIIFKQIYKTKPENQNFKMINWVFDLCSNMPSFILVIFLLVLMMLVDKNKCIFIAKAFVTIAQLLTDFIRALIQMICNVCKRRNIKFCSESHVHSDEHSPVEVQLSNLRNDIDEIKHIVSPHADSMPIQRRVSHAQNYVGCSSTP